MMKEFKIEEILPVEALKSKIWSMFDILRSERIASEDYHVLLFLLSAYKDGLFNTEILNENSNLNERLVRCLHNSESELTNQYNAILATFEPLVMRLSENGTRHIISALGELNLAILDEHFADIFDAVLYRITQSQGRFGGEFIQPVELTRFICGLAELQPNSKVYNPFAGLASFGVYLDQGQDYFGQELNQKTWALGALRIMAYQRPGTSRYVCDDSISHWPATSEKFDFIVANPPYGMRLGNQYREIEPEFRTIEQFLLEKGVHSLNEKGKLIALLPQGILFRGLHEQRLREFLVDEDLIDTIISLPGGLLLNTGIPLIIMVLNKNKKIPGKVRFVDAKKFVDSKSPRERVLNDYGLNSFLYGSKNDSDILRLVSNDEIRAFDYNLSVPRYFQKQVEGVKLGEIIEFVRGQRVNLPPTGKLIRIRDLKDDKIDFRLDEATIEDVELRRPDIHQITESCLLLAVRWKTLKPTYFEYKGEAIYRSQDILSFKVNEAIADKAFLINELHADYVQEQLESYRLGASVMPFLRKDDLMEVVIKLPSLQEQRAKVQGIYELSDKIKSLQVERNALAHGKSLKQFSEFASLKHTLGRPRQNILDWSDNLLHFLNEKREGFEALNKAFIEFYDTDIISALKEIKRDVNFITDVLEKGENGFVLSEYETNTIPLSDINSLINELSNNGFNFKIKKLPLKSEKLKDRGISANRILFKTLLDNILTNANKYAFSKRESGNEVVVELTEVDDILSMEVKNNGKPFPKNFDREKFITKYSTADSAAGTGLGGYDIHRIATHFSNPDWELSLNEDPIYPVKFKFQFPIKLMN
ncbi:MAG: N-6 DNA methylase [Sphingobacteriales bacterium]|jgi:type I restriction enzyme M protein|nr:N-6 DNA methylase [Sphingobacteriales bacterium]